MNNALTETILINWCRDVHRNDTGFQNITLFECVYHVHIHNESSFWLLNNVSRFSRILLYIQGHFYKYIISCFIFWIIYMQRMDNLLSIITISSSWLCWRLQPLRISTSHFFVNNESLLWIPVVLCCIVFAIMCTDYFH